MTRIAISIEAYEALVATLPLGTVAYEPEPNAKGVVGQSEILGAPFCLWPSRLSATIMEAWSESLANRIGPGVSLTEPMRSMFLRTCLANA
jgi:hypothetical protein